MPIRNLLLHLNGVGDMARLDVVLAMAADLGATELTAVAAGGVTPPGHGVPVGPGPMLPREQEIRSAFLTIQTEVLARVNGLRLEWRGDVTPDPTGFLIEQSARADLLVVARDARAGASLGDLDLGRLVLSAGRPVLVLPAHPPTTRFRRITVAYRRTREGRLAVQAALPVLAQADRVMVVGVGSESPEAHLVDVVAHLGCHGVFAEARHLPEHGAPAATVVELAHACDSDLIVCGAYGNGRAREWLLGGFTRDLVGDCALPCLMIH